MASSPSTKLLKKPLKLALIQLAVTPNRAQNLSHARTKVLEAAAQGANVVVLPECFNSPYGVKYFPEYAETLQPSPPTRAQSPTFHALSEMARETGTYIVGGSIPEKVLSSKGEGGADEGKDSRQAKTEAEEEAKEKDKPPKAATYYNTSLTFSPTGTLLATHRKIHLFDISIPNKITFKESEILSPGNTLTLIDLPEYGRIAVAICYDIRFPELAMIAARRGAFALLYPGAFNMTTGPLHWELQARARAVDNQVYVGLCSPARDEGAEYRVWGHSLVVDPNAEVLGELDEKEGMVVVELSGERIDEVRKGIPIYTQRRFDVYPDVSLGV